MPAPGSDGNRSVQPELAGMGHRGAVERLKARRELQGGSVVDYPDIGRRIA
jgi:hypothetical protein